MSEEKLIREVFIPIKIVKRGSARSKVMHPTEPRKNLNKPLIRGLAKAYKWETEITNFGRADWYINKNKLSKAYVRRVLKLNNLSPKIKKAIMNGEFPANILLQDLLFADINLLWSEQEKTLLKGER